MLHEYRTHYILELYPITIGVSDLFSLIRKGVNAQFDTWKCNLPDSHPTLWRKSDKYICFPPMDLQRVEGTNSICSLARTLTHVSGTEAAVINQFCKMTPLWWNSLFRMINLIFSWEAMKSIGEMSARKCLLCVEPEYAFGNMDKSEYWFTQIS